jgi:hypothetical protein
MMNPKISQNIPFKYTCEKCYYNTSNKKDYNKHILTRKHLNRTALNNLEQEKGEPEKFICKNCNKTYKARNSLWYHEQKCKKNECTLNQINIDSSITDPSDNIIQLLLKENSDFKNIIMEVIKSNTELQKQNQDFQKHMVDVCQKIQPGTINNTNSNNINTTNNKTFNLQFFLNEECKDAMNMSEFINSIQLKISDLENIGKNGYVEGVSNIIIKHLNDTDVNKRPIHCSDAKRETLYVKEENKWEKDTQETNQMLTAVRGVNKKNYQMLNTWKETHPKCTDSKSNQCDEYMKIVSKVMDGDVENINKVIKKVAKEVVIDK